MTSRRDTYGRGHDGPGREPGCPRRVLALDAAGRACSAAVWAEGAVRARRFEAMARGQSERLVPMVETVMAESGLAYGSLDAIAVTLGPGGFTGVRIGLATARGLALAWDTPLVGVTNFAAVAAAVPTAERGGRQLVVLLDAKRHELYVQAFGAGLEPASGPALLAPEALDATLPPGPLLLAGDAAEAGAAALSAAGRDARVSAAPPHAEAARIAKLVAARPLPGPDAPRLEPLYLREPAVTLRAAPGEPGEAPA